MKYILKKFFRGVGFILIASIVAVGAIAGFMYVSTGEISIDRMKEEMYSDYRDMDFNRPKKDTFFTVMMEQANSTGGSEAEQSPMSEDYQKVYESHLQRMEDSLIYLEPGDSAILDEEETIPVLTVELTEAIKDVEENANRYNDEVFMVTLNGRDELEDERVRASNEAYLNALNDLSIAIEEEDKEMFEQSIDDMESAGLILMEGVPEEE